MPIGGQTVGRDVSFQINTPNGQLTLPANFITSFDAKPLARLEKYLGVTGIINPLVFHEGWQVDISIARTGPALDQFWAVLESEYFNGIDVLGGTIYETIQESSGTTQWVFSNVQLKLEDAGTYKGNDYITQTLSGYASRRQQLL